MKKSNRSSQPTTSTPAAEQQPAPTTERPPLPRINFKERRANRMLPTEKLLNLLREEAPRFFEVCEVVGKWVWVSFGEKQPRAVTAALSELGFHWCNSRQVWQHPCGTIAETTPLDPRMKYGSYFPARTNPA